MSQNKQPIKFAQDLSWPEAPRWKDGLLWISDVHNFRVISIDAEGKIASEIKIEGRPAGMDFIENDKILIATGVSKQLLEINTSNGEVHPVADLGESVKGSLNDLVTHKNGWSWVGDTGFIYNQDVPKNCGQIFAYHPKYGVKSVISDVFFPNGMVVTPDGKSLYVNETFANKISRFDILEDGNLGNRTTHANLPGSPDGLCLDAEGYLWVPLLFEEKFVRVSSKGEVVQEINFPNKNTIACMTGGTDRKKLYLCVANIEAKNPKTKGQIYSVDIDTSGAGRP